MLLVIRAEPAIVWAPMFDRRIELQRHLRRLQRLPAELVILRVGADEHFLKPVVRAPFVQVDVAVLHDHFCFDFAKTGGAEAAREFVEDVGAIGQVKVLCRSTHTPSESRQ